MKKIVRPEFLDAAGARAIEAIRIPSHNARELGHVHAGFRRAGLCAIESRRQPGVSPVGHVATDAVPRVFGFEPQFLGARHRNVHEFRRVAASGHSAVEPLPAVHGDAEDHAAAGAGLEANFRIEAFVMAIEQERDDAVGMMAKTFFKSFLADLQRRASLFGACAAVSKPSTPQSCALERMSSG